MSFRIINFIYLGGIADIKNTQSRVEIPDKYKKYINTWMKYNPFYSIKLWGPDQIINLLEQSNTPQYLKYYLSLTSLSQKSNFIRFVIINTTGGLFCEIDYICKKPIENLIRDKKDLFFFDIPDYPNRLLTDFFYSTPNNLFITDWLSYVLKTSVDIDSRAFYDFYTTVYSNPSSVNIGNPCDINQYTNEERTSSYCKDYQEPYTYPDIINRFYYDTDGDHYKECLNHKLFKTKLIIAYMIGLLVIFLYLYSKKTISLKVFLIITVVFSWFIYMYRYRFLNLISNRESTKINKAKIIKPSFYVSKNLDVPETLIDANYKYINPSIIKIGDITYIWFRKSLFQGCDGGEMFLHPINNINQHVFGIMDKDGNVEPDTLKHFFLPISKDLLKSSPYKKFNSSCPYFGVEDVRMLYDPRIDKVICTGSYQICSVKNMIATTVIYYAELDYLTGNISNEKLLAPVFTELSKQEKNWVPFMFKSELYFIYSLHPFVIIKPDLNTSMCSIYKKQDYVIPFKTKHGLRGGSSLIVLDDGNYLGIGHTTDITGSLRKYKHFFYLINSDLDIVGMTNLFCIDAEDCNIQFSIGMTISDEGKVSVVYGENDCVSKLITYELSNILKDMIPIIN